MKTPVWKKRKVGGKMLVRTYGLFAHPMSMITTVGKHLLGNGDSWLNFLWSLPGFQPTDHEDDDDNVCN